MDNDKPKLLILCWNEDVLFRRMNLDKLKEAFDVTLTHQGFDTLRALDRDPEIGVVVAAHSVAEESNTQYDIARIKREFPGVTLIGMAAVSFHDNLREWGCVTACESSKLLETLQARDIVWARPPINPS
jgi:hypothetical protein